MHVFLRDITLAFPCVCDLLGILYIYVSWALTSLMQYVFYSGGKNTMKNTKFPFCYIENIKEKCPGTLKKKIFRAHNIL